MSTLVLGYNIGQLVSGSHGQGSSQFRLWMFPRSWERGRGSIQQTCCGVSSELLSCSEGGVTRPHHKARAAQEISGVIHPSPHRAVLKWGNALSHTPVTCAYMQSAYEDIQCSYFWFDFSPKSKYNYVNIKREIFTLRCQKYFYKAFFKDDW